jgi:tetratricopeptide (TPR) repeat protein
MMKSPTIFSFTPSLMNAADLESIFVQRKATAADLVDRIRESVLTPTKHHSLIIGARGMGKTHLVSLVYHRVQAMVDLHDRILIAWLREEEWGITSFLKLLLRILRAIDSADPAIQKQIEALYELSSADAEQAAMSLLTEIIGERTLLLITENLDDLFKGLGEQGQQQLRAFLQNSGCCTILATAPRLFNGVQSRNKPFYGFFRPVRLQELTAAEAVQLLIRIASLREQTELVSFLKTPMGKARVQAVEHLAGGNPRIYVIFAEFLSRESLEELVQPFMALLDALTPYYQSRMQYLSAQQREIVEFLCDRKYPATVKDIAQRCFITSQTTSSQLKELKEKGYVTVESIGRESFYALQEPLMRICLGMKKERDSTLKFMVDFLRAWYSKDELDMLHQKISDGFMQEYLELALQANITIEQDPRVAIYLYQTKEYSDLGLFKEALQYTQKLIAIRGSAEDWIQQAHVLVQSEQWAEALNSCENALNIGSGSSLLWFMHGLCLSELCRYEEALRSYSKSIEMESDWHVIFYAQGISLSMLDRKEDAVYSFDQAIKFKPDDFILWRNRGNLLCELDRQDEAVYSFDQAIKFKPDDPCLWLFRGFSLEVLKNHEEAINSFDKAIQLKADFVDFLWELRGLSLLNLGQFKESLASFDKAISLQSNNHETWFRRGVSLRELEHHQEAIASYDRAIQLKSDHHDAWSYRGDSLFNLGSYQEAIDSFEKAIKINPNDLDTVISHSELLLATNRWNEGTEEMKDILNRLQQSNESYHGDIEPVLRGLLTQDSSHWKTRIADLISWFEPFPIAITNGLVSACKKLISPLISDTAANLWHDTWHELTHHLPEYQLPLRLLTTALHYKQKPDDPKVWMELSIEERKILQQALGIDSVEPRD